METGAEQGATVPRRAWFAVAAAAVGVHGTLWWLDTHPAPRALWGDEVRYLASARALLAGDPSWRPDPLWPPLYPRFIAGLTALGGPELAWVRIVQTLLLAAAAVLLADLTRRVSGSRLAGFVAGSLALIYPPLVGFAHFLWPEVLHLFLLLAVVWILVARSDRPAWCGVAGVAAGLALLTKSLLLPFLPVLGLAAFARRPVGPAVGRAAVFLIAAILTVTPTVLEQHRRTGRLMIADSSSFNLWVGLNDRARRNFDIDVVSGLWEEYAASGDSFAERDAILRARIRQFLDSRPWPSILRAQLGRQYFRLFDKDSYLTDQLPGGAATERYGAGYRRASPAVARAVRLASYTSYALLLVAAPLGLLCWRYRDRRWLAVLLLFVLYNLGIFLWLHVKSRYRIQLAPVAFLGAGGAAALLAAVRRGDVTVDRWRWIAAAGVAAVLELLAFGGALLR